MSDDSSQTSANGTENVGERKCERGVVHLNGGSDGGSVILQVGVEIARRRTMVSFTRVLVCIVFFPANKSYSATSSNDTITSFLLG